ncbi:MAG: CDP-alcohol phosphatidyltransferase family protein, partial [Candidatus Ranarchaeia archaeon]
MPESEDGLIARTINRKISKRISKYLLSKHPNVTANQITIFCFVLGLLGAIFYPFGYPIVAGLLLQVSSILDGCDGEIARSLNS